MTTLSLLAALDREFAIGKDGDLPWHLPADLKRFKALTMGSTMIMGRKTFESLPGLLPGRRHVVLTRDRGWTAPGAEVVHTVDDALRRANGDPVSIIGGAEIFSLFLPLVSKLELTEILADVPGDTCMADPRGEGHWRETFREEQPAEDGRRAFRFLTLERA